MNIDLTEKEALVVIPNRLEKQREDFIGQEPNVRHLNIRYDAKVCSYKINDNQMYLADAGIDMPAITLANSAKCQFIDLDLIEILNIVDGLRNISSRLPVNQNKYSEYDLYNLLASNGNKLVITSLADSFIKSKDCFFVINRQNKIISKGKSLEEFFKNCQNYNPTKNNDGLNL